MNSQISETARKNAELNKKEKLLGKTILESTPTRISLNMTGRCNSKCSYCALSLPKSQYYTSEEMSLEIFKCLKPFLPAVSSLVYFANAEPLIAKNFREIFEESAKYHMEKYLSTNAIALTKKMSEFLVINKLNFLQISISAANRNSYHRIHQVDVFKKIISNINELNKIKARYSTEEPRLRFTFTLMKDNAHELCDALRLASKLGFSEGVQLRHLIAYSEEFYDQIVSESIDSSNDKIYNHIEDAKILADKLGIPLTGDYVDMDYDHRGDPVDLKPEEARDLDHYPCYEPYERLHIEADGKTRPCTSYTGNHFSGDLRTQTIWEAWNSDLMQYYRKNINTINEPEGCRDCTSGHQRNRQREDIWRQKDSNILIYPR